MNLWTEHPLRRPDLAGERAAPRGPLHCQAFTLVEMMVAAGLFSLVIAGILTCHLAGLRLQQIIQPRLLNAQYERQTVGRLIEEVRCANSVQVGTGSLSSFTAAGPTNVQAGNALRVYPSTNTSQYTYYFHDSATATIRRVPFRGATAATIIASAVTNHTIFTMQDSAGNALTNAQNNAVMSVLLQFYIASVQKGVPDSAQVRAKVTRRNIL